MKHDTKEGELPANFKMNLDDFDVEDEDDGFDMSEPSDSETESSEEEIDVDEFRLKSIVLIYGVIDTTYMK